VNNKATSAASANIANSKAKTMDATRFILNRIKKLTIGWSTIAKMTAKTNGTIMLCAMYNIATNAIKPIRKIDIFA
jgi:hypothetical protein